MGVVYAGVFLEEASREKLWSWWEQTRGPLHPKMHCHHMTVAFKPSPALIESFPFRSHTTLKVVGWMADEFCQVVRVQYFCAGPIVVENRNPHITIATNNKSPAYSNDLLAEMGTVGVIGGPELSGWTGLWDGKLQKPLFAPVEDGPTLEDLSGSLKT